MSKFDRIVEESIKKAIEEGEFDNLQGIGKPIKWNDNPYSSEEMKLVEEIFKKNEISYPWIEKRKEIENMIEGMKQIIKSQKSLSAPDELELTEQINLINKKIFDYNLSVPVARLQRRSISLQDFLSSRNTETD